VTDTKVLVKLTANFERCLEAVELFLQEAEAPSAYDMLIDELLGTVIPNLENFPDMGRLFLERPIYSVEVSNGIDSLQAQLKMLGDSGQVREYVLAHYLLLYARIDNTIYLLSIRHHRQLSFDFQALWRAS
jgi:plasmid stabilization system protein ParE